MKKIFTLFLVTFLPVLANAYDAKIDGIYYNFSGDKATVVKSSNEKYSGSVIIPSSVIFNGKTYSVSSIGDYAFIGCEALTSITIPGSVTRIGAEAFDECRDLKKVIVQDIAAWLTITSIMNKSIKQLS